jgi:hypothetical protein
METFTELRPVVVDSSYNDRRIQCPNALNIDEQMWSGRTWALPPALRYYQLRVIRVNRWVELFINSFEELRSDCP